MVPVAMERSSDTESNMQLERSRSASKLSDQLLMAAFGGHLPSPPGSAGKLTDADDNVFFLKGNKQ